MPEVTVNIYSRAYRLAVSTGEEALLQRCAEIVDRQMRNIREGGKVINQDQIAVLAALEVAYEASKAASARDGELARLTEAKDAEIAALKARIAELEAMPAPAAAPERDPDKALLKEIEALTKLCENAIFSDIRKNTLL
ncbi:MAG: cell division protein ZapA [Sutterella sp.]|nr:cell division protein ZapA [Sutterella sp.]